MYEIGTTRKVNQDNYVFELVKFWICVYNEIVGVVIEKPILIIFCKAVPLKPYFKKEKPYSACSFFCLSGFLASKTNANNNEIVIVSYPAAILVWTSSWTWSIVNDGSFSLIVSK